MVDPDGAAHDRGILRQGVGTSVGGLVGRVNRGSWSVANVHLRKRLDVLCVTKNDTAGEVMFAGSSTLTHRVFEDRPNVNHAYVRLRQRYQK
jgi:hypothetical protein